MVVAFPCVWTGVCVCVCNTCLWVPLRVTLVNIKAALLSC